MGYNLSIRSVHRVEAYLQTMSTTYEDITWKPPKDVTPFYLAYWIREGIRAAEHLASKGNTAVHPYCGLLDKFSIRHRRDTVTAEFKVAKLEAFRVGMGTMTLTEPTDSLEMIGALLKHKNAEKVHFPNATPSAHLSTWAEKNGWKVVYDEENGTTLVKGELDGVEEWVP